MPGLEIGMLPPNLSTAFKAYNWYLLGEIVDNGNPSYATRSRAILSTTGNAARTCSFCRKKKSALLAYQDDTVVYDFPE
jgi:hypothetical protein